MKNLIEMRFFSLFSTGQSSILKEDELIESYGEYAAKLMDYCRGEDNFVILIQTLGYARVEFLYLKEKLTTGQKKKCTG